MPLFAVLTEGLRSLVQRSPLRPRCDRGMNLCGLRLRVLSCQIERALETGDEGVRLSGAHERASSSSSDLSHAMTRFPALLVLHEVRCMIDVEDGSPVLVCFSGLKGWRGALVTRSPPALASSL